jgi:hypothetical protein
MCLCAIHLIDVIFSLQDYLLSNLNVRPIDGAAMVRQMKLNMEAMLAKKVEAVHVSNTLYTLVYGVRVLSFVKKPLKALHCPLTPIVLDLLAGHNGWRTVPAFIKAIRRRKAVEGRGGP